MANGRAGGSVTHGHLNVFKAYSMRQGVLRMSIANHADVYVGDSGSVPDAIDNPTDLSGGQEPTSNARREYRLIHRSIIDGISIAGNSLQKMRRDRDHAPMRSDGNVHL